MMNTILKASKCKATQAEVLVLSDKQCFSYQSKRWLFRLDFVFCITVCQSKYIHRVVVVHFFCFGQCERCHGPSAEHVDFHTKNPDVKTARFITSYKTLSRTQKLDACAVCHSGNKSLMLKSIFIFKPGNKMAAFKKPELKENHADNKNIDVHGNQLQLLESRKCFINSQMDCASCHNTHVNERSNFQLFAQRCLNCHKDETHHICKMIGELKPNIFQDNCIKCHMPK